MSSYTDADREYYLRTRQLKGRKKGSGQVGSGGRQLTAVATVNSPEKTRAAKERVERLKGKVATLQDSLTKTLNALAEKRRNAKEEERKNSDGKTTAKERQSAKEYREKNEQKIAEKRRQDAKTSKSSGGSSSTSSSKSVSDMSVEQLESRVIKIRSALSDAKRQLSNASQQLGQLAHSEITSEPSINEQFARFRSAERISSK